MLEGILKNRPKKSQKQAGAELCQAQDHLGLIRQQTKIVAESILISKSEP